MGRTERRRWKVEALCMHMRGSVTIRPSCAYECTGTTTCVPQAHNQRSRQLEVGNASKHKHGTIGRKNHFRTNIHTHTQCVYQKIGGSEGNEGERGDRAGIRSVRRFPRVDRVHHRAGVEKCHQIKDYTLQVHKPARPQNEPNFHTTGNLGKKEAG